jgi:diaminopimelate epimerase
MTKNIKGRLYDAAGNRILWLDSRGANGRREDDARFARLRVAGYELSQRFDVGQDLTAVLFSSPRTLRALFWNRDGSYEMTCGNAIRCLAHFIGENASHSRTVSVETPYATYVSRKLDAYHACAVVSGKTVRVAAPHPDGDFLVDVGTPHRIRLVDDEWRERDLADAITHSTAPEPKNFSLVRRVAPCRFRVRIFERGVGETSSCGTAAVSIVAALGSPAGTTTARTSHLVDFASGEKLTVVYDPASDCYEVGGRVTLLESYELGGQVALLESLAN